MNENSTYLAIGYGFTLLLFLGYAVWMVRRLSGLRAERAELERQGARLESEGDGS